MDNNEFEKQKNKFITNIEKDPELYKIINSTEHMFIFQKIYENPQSDEKFKREDYFKNISVLYNILDTLISKKLIKKITVNNNEMYYTTEYGNEFYKMYDIIKNKFKLM